MSIHPHVPHPHTKLLTTPLRLHDIFLNWVADHVLASRVMFDVALILPLLVLPMSSSVKLILGVVSSNWVQWWALPALQRSQVRADVMRNAKADADHEALTHLATTLDEVKTLLTERGAADDSAG